MRIGRAGNVAHHRGQVEPHHALVFSGLEAICPQAGLFRIALDQLDRFVVTPGQLQVFDGLLVDIKHRRS